MRSRRCSTAVRIPGGRRTASTGTATTRRAASLTRPLGKAVYVYPNGQEAAPIWFHDHMLGATRLNVYAGIAGGYVITEPASTLAPGLHPLGLSDYRT